MFYTFLNLSKIATQIHIHSCVSITSAAITSNYINCLETSPHPVPTDSPTPTLNLKLTLI